MPVPVTNDPAAIQSSINFSTIIISLSSGIVAAGLSVVANWFIFREKLRFDLYNRRFEIYSKTLDFYQTYLRHSSESKDVLDLKQKNFIISCRESLFLFEPKSGIYEILKEIDTRTFKVIGSKELLKEHKGLPPEIFLKTQQEEIETLKWLNDAIPKLEMAMSSYLNFHKI
ncbi:MAG: hypothetical protein ACYDFU_08035 [Nitrospirota bacterium]